MGACCSEDAIITLFVRFIHKVQFRLETCEVGDINERDSEILSLHRRTDLWKKGRRGGKEDTWAEP